MRTLAALLFNHVDAWGLTLFLAVLSLALHDALAARGLLLALALTYSYWFGFALNDYFDAAYDQHDPRKARRNAFCRLRDAASSAPGLLARDGWGLKVILCLSLLPPFVAFAGFGAIGIMAFALALAAAWAYSAPPLRLKARPGFDLFMHVLFVETFPYVCCLVLLRLPLVPVDAVLIPALLLGSLAAQLEQQARDYDLDRRTEQTFTTRYGLSLTTRLLRTVTAVFGGVLIGGLLAGTIPLWVAPFGAIGFPVMWHRFVRPPGAPRSEWLVRFVLVGIVMYGGALLWRGIA